MEYVVLTVNAWQAAGTWVTAVGTLVTAGVLAATLIVIGRQVREAERLRRQQARPYVVAAVDVRQRMLLALTIENTGNLAAHDVRLHFDQDPQSTLGDLNEATMVTHGLPMVPPGRTFQVHWESALTVFNDEKPYPHPTRYDVTVTYDDGDGNHYEDDYVLDFNQFYGLAVGERGLNELGQELESIRKELQGWRGPPGSGLLTYNINGDRQEYLKDRNMLIRQVGRLRQSDGKRAAATKLVRFWLARRKLPIPALVKRR